ncbi:MAG: 5-(carboxyamino)imidazole ribonucleotide mutase [Prevotellaceae bacterium]|jgi:5-(carboxyamino)imidazole ribonucleotide mutase|nr:5-(carboxyamino)imidazole ribonucleotide mutase [Prevotellaceae bacterium]
MKPLVSIVMGSASDLPVMSAAAKFLNDLQIPFEINALSAHRVPEMVFDFAKKLCTRGVKVVIAGAGGAAHLPGIIAALTPIPVIGVPIKSANSMDGWDSVLSILQMPSGIPVATVALDGAHNAGILAAQILATGNEELLKKIQQFKNDLADKIAKANDELKNVVFAYRVGGSLQ